MLPDRSSAYHTPDDKISAAEDLEELQSREAGVDEDHPVNGTGDQAPIGEEWALDLLKELQPKIIVATKELNEAVTASEELQKAQEERAAASGVLWENILKFKHLVRDTFGSHSREFHSLRDRMEKVEKEEKPKVEPERTPA